MLKHRYLQLVVLFIIGLGFSAKSQNVNADTLNLDTLNANSLRVDTVGVDSILLVKDGIQIVVSQDTIRGKQVTDSITLRESESQAMDTVFKDTKEIDYRDFFKLSEDSLIFEEPDSAFYFAYGLRDLIDSSYILFEDTARQAVDILLKYYRGREIKESNNYFRFNLNKGKNLFHFKDSSLNYLKDSVQSAIRYLLDNIPKDSLNLFFVNSQSDSIFLETSENELDSIHIQLFDNREEEAMLWIKKTDKDIFSIFLEDGYYLEKAQQQRILDQTLDAEIPFPELRKVEKVNMTIALWEFDGMADVRFNQGFVSESWVEGGESSMSALSVLKYSADYSYGKMRNLDTDVEYRLGYLKSGNNSLRKNNDKFEINAKYGRSAFNNWYYSALLNFKTQLFVDKENLNDSTEVSVSNFLSPAHLVFSLGLDYKPGNNLTVLISPLTSKFTIVADTVSYDQTRFGVGANERTRSELGAYVKAISKLKIKNNIFIENKINFFTNYTNNPQNIDIDWEIDIGIQLTDYIKISVNTHVLYDDDVEIPVIKGGEQVSVTKNFQLKEIFGVGFVYNF